MSEEETTPQSGKKNDVLLKLQHQNWTGLISPSHYECASVHGVFFFFPSAIIEHLKQRKEKGNVHQMKQESTISL